MQESQETKKLIRSIICELHYSKKLRDELREVLNDIEEHEDKRFRDDRDWSHHMIKPNGWY